MILYFFYLLFPVLGIAALAVCMLHIDYALSNKPRSGIFIVSWALALLSSIPAWYAISAYNQSNDPSSSIVRSFATIVIVVFFIPIFINSIATFIGIWKSKRV